MKQVFDDAGIAQVQVSVVVLPATELTAEVAFIRTNLKGIPYFFQHTTYYEKKLRHPF